MIQLCLQFEVSEAILCKHNGIDELAERLPTTLPVYTYAILRGPRIHFVPDRTRLTEHHVQSEIVVDAGEWQLQFEIHFDIAAEYRDLAVAISPSGSEIVLMRDGEICHSISATEHITTELAKDGEGLPYEVAYIGQAYGTDGDRSAVERLQSHASLQRIYADTLDTSASREVWLLLMSMRYGRSGIVSVTEGNAPTSEARILQAADALLRPVSQKTSVNLAEAAMIHYFQPHYNSTFKDVFPSRKHASYSEYFESGFDSLEIVLDTGAAGIELFSESRAPAAVHVIRYTSPE